MDTHTHSNKFVCFCHFESEFRETNVAGFETKDINLIPLCLFITDKSHNGCSECSVLSCDASSPVNLSNDPYRKNFITPENTQTAATISQGNLTISELEAQLMLNFMANKKAV